MAVSLKINVDKARARILGSRDLFSISELYHENSKITSCAPGIAQSAESVLVTPSAFKRYIHAPRVGLPTPRIDRPSDIRSVITDRRSCRTYSGKSIKLESVSELAFYSLGMPDGGYRRCSPSAGGLYPLELYVVSLNIEGLESGLYYYNARSHDLSQVERSDYRPRLANSIVIKEPLEGAGAVIVLTGMFGRSKIKYGERAYRFVLLEAGHAMQNICLIATSLELGACPIGGFVDDHMHDLLNVDGIEEAALYAVTLGSPTSNCP